MNVDDNEGVVDEALQEAKQHEIRVVQKLLPRMMNCLSMPTIGVYLVGNSSISIHQSMELQGISGRDRGEAITKLAYYLQTTQNPAKKLMEALHEMQRDGNGSEESEKLAKAIEKMLNTNSLHSSRTTVNDIVSHSRSPSIGSRHAISRFTQVHSTTSTAQALSEHTDNASPPPSPPFLSPSSQKAFSQVPTPWIASEYATFGVKVVDVIEKLVPQRVHLWLTLKYSPRDDKHGGSYMYHKLRLDDASQSIYQLLTSLNQQTCWYDYDPLASLATELGGDEGKKLVEDYEHKLQVYYSKTLATTTSPQIRRQFVAKSAPALTTVDYCAVSTVPTSTTPTFRHGKILVTPKKSKQKFESNYSCSLSPRRQALPVPIRKPLTPTNDRVSFRKLILTRASMECPANLRMTAIRHHQARTSLEITVTQGEHLIAVYQRSTEIFAQTQNGSRGFIPSDVTFLSSLYQTDPLKEIVYNTYEITSAGYKPLQAIVVKQHLARHTTELTVHKNTRVHILFHAKQWVYAVTEGRQAGFLHESHILYTSTH